LNALNREGKLFEHSLFKKFHGITSSPSRIQPEDSDSRAIINGRKLEKTRGYLGCIHLNALAWYLFVVTIGLGWSGRTFERLNFVTIEDFPDSGR
jgi:hypothetical protein